MVVTAPGRRYYADEMDGFAEAKAAVAMLSSCKIRAYNNQYRRLYAPDGFDDPSAGKARPVYEDLRSYGLTSVYANALEPYVTGLLKSQASNMVNRAAKLEDDISAMYDKLNTLGDELAKKKALKDSIMQYAKTGTWEKPYPKCTIAISGDVLAGYSIMPQDYRVYERRLDRKISRLERRMSSIFEGTLHREAKKAAIEASPVPTKAIFGGRELYRMKDTVCRTAEDMAAWKESFHKARYSSVSLSGRADSPHGNHLVQWDWRTYDITWRLPGGGKCVFPGFLPAHYTEEFLACLHGDNFSRSTVSYTIELRTGTDGREYFLVWASFTPLPDPWKNTCTVDGIIAVDINADRLAWADLSAEGERLGGGTIPMELTGLSTGQASDAIGRAVKLLITECSLAHKPLAMESLDAKGMVRKQKYGNKKKNRRVSQFAVNRIVQTIMAQAERASVGVISVNPAYTSFAGKLLYMRKYGISVHEAASCVIGLLALGIYPEVPGTYASLIPARKPKKKGMPLAPETEKEAFYRKWRGVYRALSGIRAHAFYLDVKPQRDKKSFRAWFRAHDVLHPEAAATPGG